MWHMRLVRGWAEQKLEKANFLLLFITRVSWPWPTTKLSRTLDTSVLWPKDDHTLPSKKRKDSEKISENSKNERKKDIFQCNIPRWPQDDGRGSGRGSKLQLMQVAIVLYQVIASVLSMFSRRDSTFCLIIIMLLNLLTKYCSINTFKQFTGHIFHYKSVLFYILFIGWQYIHYLTFLWGIYRSLCKRLCSRWLLLSSQDLVHY